MPTIPYSRAALTDDTRRKLGDSFYAEFLSLGYQVNEVQLYMQFVLACLPHEYPENTPFREKARINGNASVRLLCARLYEVSNLVGKMGSSVNWRKGFPLVAESFKKNMNDSQEGITTRRKTAEFDLVRLVRDKGFAHISPQEVHKRLNKTHANAQRFLYFSDTYANAFSLLAKIWYLETCFTITSAEPMVEMWTKMAIANGFRGYATFVPWFASFSIIFASGSGRICKDLILKM